MPLALVDYFDTYTSIGFKIIPLYYKTKHPICDNWQDENAYNRYDIRRAFESGKSYNLGLLLGEFVDVEGDTEEANAQIEFLSKDIPHLKYRSSKSVHHLFLNPDKNLTRRTCNGIEFRAARHQSVLPPSVHIDGSPYTWIGKPVAPRIPMPQPLWNFYIRNFKQITKKQQLKPNHRKINCFSCGKDFYVSIVRLNLESAVFKRYDKRWLCQGCREMDIRAECIHLKKKTRF